MLKIKDNADHAGHFQLLPILKDNLLFIIRIKQVSVNNKLWIVIRIVKDAMEAG